MHNTLKVLIQIGWIVLTLNVWACRQTNEPPIEEDMLAGKAFFTGPTPVSQHHGIQVIAYLKSDTVLTPVDTTSTDSTGFYSFGKPSLDGVYVLTAYYRLYYPDTVTVKFQGGRREGEIRDMQIRQLARVKFMSEKSFYQLTDTFTWTVQVSNISNNTLHLPDASWFGCERWNELFFVSETKPESKFTHSISGFPCHPPAGCSGLAPSTTMTLTRTVPITAFTDETGNRMGTGKYLFYASNRSCLPLVWNGRVLPIFEPTEVEIVP
ncbi:MAG: hypothetical protein ONA90_03040 [candidate division KSB1 bacterium]|nr:hypothetical protein [candidate division KSB1 bacterium]